MNSFTEPAAQIIVSLIPMVGIFFGCVIVFFYLLWHHRQIMLQLRNGIYKPVSFDFKLFSLLAGLLLVGVGAVLSVLFLLIDGLTYSLLGGLIPFALGVGLLVFFRMYNH